MRGRVARIRASAAAEEYFQSLQDRCMSLAVRPAEPAAPSRLVHPPRAIVLGILLGFALTARTLYRPESHTVFPVFAAGSKHWWADRPLYANYRPMDYFRYPPLFAIVITPLAVLGPIAG